MESQLLLLTITQSILILLLTLAMVFLGVQLWKFNQKKNLSKTTPSESESIESIENKEGYCSFHPTIKAESTCAICEKLLCESCNRSYETLHFCPEHFQLFHNNEWQILDSIKTNPDDAHLSEYLFKFKKELWEIEKSPLYIQVHYQINVQNDDIESEVQLFCTKESLEQLEKQLTLFKNQGTKQ